MNFLWDKDIVDWKTRSRGQCMAHNQDIAIGGGLNPILQVLKIDANSETLCRFDTVKLKHLELLRETS